MSKPSIPKGTRDFGPTEMARRNYIFGTIRSTFQKYGYQPIETPAMETLNTLLGKYGEEGDRLIFKILNSGDFLTKQDLDSHTAGNSLRYALSISEKALRYDLTVPFARYVVQNQHQLSFPFKRYQIQPVWRADRPQKGRYREFYQCDVDVIGSDSLLNEVELVQIMHEGFSALGLPDVTLRINNRKVLSGIAEAVGAADRIIDITVAIDKLDKIGLEGVNKEMLAKGVSQEAVDALQPIIQLAGSNQQKLDQIRQVLGSSEIGLKGVEELETVFTHCNALGISNLALDLTLARGLNYYTGAIFEVTHPDFKSSICGGGRYDDLTGIFGMPNMSGVGISFGADRIYDLLLDKELFPNTVEAATKVMFANFGDAETPYGLQAVTKLRAAGISAELFPDSKPMRKQLKYANEKGVQFVVMAGSREIESGELTVKDMLASTQEHLTLEALIDRFT